VDILTIKAQRALVATKFSQLVVAGGVSANRKLRQRLQASLPGIEIFSQHFNFAPTMAPWLRF